MTRTPRRLLLVSLIVGLVLADVTIAAAHSQPAPVPVTSSSITSSYTVKAGDSLVGIAHRFGMPLDDFLRVNSMTMRSVIRPGDVVKVAVTTPATGSTSASAKVSTYTVRPGDALASIASRHGVPVTELRSLNGLTPSSVIHPGQVLRLPAGSTPGAPAAAGTSAPTSVAAASDSATRLVSYLRAQEGKPYKFFTAGPDTFDCSGLVVAGYRSIGVELPHQSRALSTRGAAVDWTTSPIRAGDLVFLASSSDPTRIGHVGVALDSATWIQAVGTGQFVRIRALPASSRIVAVRRIMQP